MTKPTNKPLTNNQTMKQATNQTQIGTTNKPQPTTTTQTHHTQTQIETTTLRKLTHETHNFGINIEWDPLAIRKMIYIVDTGYNFSLLGVGCIN